MNTKFGMKYNAKFGNRFATESSEQNSAQSVFEGTCTATLLTIKHEKLKLRKVRIRILRECLVVVDSLSSNNLVRNKASSCKFRLKT
jgi:hypothetical protein